MQKRYHSAQINVFVEPEDKEFFKNYCEKQNRSVSMVIRDHIKLLRIKEEVLNKAISE